MNRPLHFRKLPTLRYCRNLFFFSLILLFSTSARASCNAGWTYSIHGDTVFLQSADTASTNHHYWSFNGVFNTSNQTTLYHVYPNYGTYHICQYVYTVGGSCSDSLCQDITIQATTPPCNLNTSWTYTIHGDSLFVTASDTNRLNHHYWTFGSTTSTSNSLTATFVFPQQGIYRVCLHEYTPQTNCVDSFCQNITYTGAGTTCHLNTAWTYTTHGDTVYVTAADTNSANHHYWTFGSYTNTANSLTASYVFPQPGTYRVCLHEYTPGGSCADSLCQYVTVQSTTPCNVTAAWQSLVHGDTVTFYAVVNNNTTTHYYWNFGDGSAYGTGTQPTHVYATAGTYHVCLYEYIPNTTCADSSCHDVTVTTVPCHVSAAWTYTIHGDTVFLHSTDTSSINNHYWTFGSGTTYASGVSVYHVFPNYGVNRICLHVYTPGTSCNDSSCNVITLPYPCHISAAWTYSASGNVYHFYAADTSTNVQRVWTFGDGSSGSGTNPVHTYTTAGTYHVCLRSYGIGSNCVDSFCSTITV
ncbi:MAG: hypothetical protein JWO03_3120, partial [Bacteroidetes bacterium]|nr:hypothetical protein [Bacteroidota bacterium]